MNGQIYMASINKRIHVEAHKFYCSQVKKRIFSQFNDIENDAQKFADERLEHVDFDSENDEPAAIYESVHEEMLNYYALLDDLRRDVFLGGLAGLYHLWDKTLRDFLYEEFLHSFIEHEKMQKYIWGKDIDKIFDILEECGWDFKGEAFFQQIDACREVVNAYKHGEGRAFEKIQSRYPQFLKHYASDDAESIKFHAEHARYDSLSIDENQFDDFADALLQFWQQFPERLSYTPQHKFVGKILNI